VKSFIVAYLLLCWILPINGYAAKPGSILNVSHALRMSSSEPEPARDYFVDLGARDGLKEGDVLTVSRQLYVGSANWSGPNHLIRVALGEVKVITLGETASIARAVGTRPAAELPSLDYPGFLIGDAVEAKTDLPIRGTSF